MTSTVTPALFGSTTSIRLASKALSDIRRHAENDDFGFSFMSLVRGFPKDGFEGDSLKDLVEAVAAHTSDTEAVRILNTSWEEINGYEGIVLMPNQSRSHAYRQLKKLLHEMRVDSAISASIAYLEMGPSPA